MNAPRRMRVWRGCAAVAAAFGCLAPHVGLGRAAEPRYTFAVISGVVRTPADESAAQRLLEAIGLDASASFVVYDGNIKGADEPCADALYERRLQWLRSSPVPLVLLPGQHDWVDCASMAAGVYDAAERLDFLRQTFFSDSVSLGRPTLALTRESEVSRFRRFRENVRWVMGDTVFVGLDVVGDNNHYSDAGGRNGEFDDRAIASTFWLEHAAEYAKRRSAKALVVFVEADPDFARYEEHADRFKWLRFARHRKRDGYLEFKRSLVNAARTFHGPVIVIHHSARPLASGFVIDQPLFNDKGVRIANLTRIAIAPRDATQQWVSFDVGFGRPAPFRVSVHTVPRKLPNAPLTPWQAPSSPIDAPGPVIGPLPGIQYVPPAEPNAAPPVPAAPASEPPLLPAGTPDGTAPAPANTSPSPSTSPSPPSAPQPAGSDASPQPGAGSMQGGGS